MDDKLRRRLEAQLNVRPAPAIERLRSFLLDYVADGDRETLQHAATTDRASFIDAVEAIDDVLATRQQPGVLQQIVAYNANRRLADRTDEAAAAWLRSLAGDLRRCLGDQAPATPEESDEPGER